MICPACGKRGLHRSTTPTLLADYGLKRRCCDHCWYHWFVMHPPQLPTAARGNFPFRNHRTMAQVMATENEAAA